jgi:hypothetical protein
VEHDATSSRNDRFSLHKQVIMHKKGQLAMSALKMLRSKLIATMAPTLLSGGTAAFAQNQGTGSSGASTIPQAPIGHRQPRADQVPSEKNQSNPSDVLAKENALLDRKMKGICRGC